MLHSCFFSFSQIVFLSGSQQHMLLHPLTETRSLWCLYRLSPSPWPHLFQTLLHSFLIPPNTKTNTDMPPCFLMLHFTAPCRYCVFYKLKVCGNPEWNKSIGTIFPQHVLPSHLCYISVIHELFQTFSLLFIFVMVICDQWLWLAG